MGLGGVRAHDAVGMCTRTIPEGAERISKVVGAHCYRLHSIFAGVLYSKLLKREHQFLYLYSHVSKAAVDSHPTMLVRGY